MSVDRDPTYDGGASRLRPTGTMIAHYRLIEKVDEGGMGLVHKAVDTKLGRTVALKFLQHELTLDPKARGRFIQEARAASALDHPNICTIFQIDETRDGETFLAMAFYEGETLKRRIERGPLRLDDALEIASQVALGLSKAHARGIVHRDIKPANVFLTNDGLVKILDFGLAKLVGESKLTKTGSTLGTARYMSPEQARGQEADERSDIWSLGVVLYEMVAGKAPFGADYDQATLYAILNEEPEPLTAVRAGVPREIDRIVAKALAKDPAERYQHAEDLMVDLKRLAKSVALRGAATQVLKGAPRPPAARGGRALRRPLLVAAPIIAAAAVLIVFSAKYLHRAGHEAEQAAAPTAGAPAAQGWTNSIAVLPFRDFSPGKDQEYFCDGMTEDLITKLSKIPGLKVISHTSVAQYKNTTKTTAEIARELGVATILEGSIQKERDRVRINAQLIAAADDAHLWAERYDRTLESAFAIQDEISMAIARALQMTLTPQTLSRAAPGASSNIEAYDYFRKGTAAWQAYAASGDEKDFERGKAHLERAIALDSMYADAHAALARLYGSHMARTHDDSSYALALKHIDAAYRLDPDGALPNIGKARALLASKNFAAAFAHTKKALLANPNIFETNEMAARFLRQVGLMRQALPYLRKAYELQPALPMPPYMLGMSYFSVASLDTAEQWLRKTLEIAPDYVDALGLYGYLLIYKGELDRTAELLDRVERIDPAYPYLKHYRAYLHAARGEKEPALALVRDDVVYSLLGMKDEAIRALEKQIAEPENQKIARLYPWLAKGPEAAPIRSDPRFQRILAGQKRIYEEMLEKYGDL